jgi:DNA-binding transcriptional regulator LsrR (DeoR family)
MPTGRLSMRRIRDVLRLKYAQGMSDRAISASLVLGKGTVGAYLGRARARVAPITAWIHRGGRSHHVWVAPVLASCRLSWHYTIEGVHVSGLLSGTSPWASMGPAGWAQNIRPSSKLSM